MKYIVLLLILALVVVESAHLIKRDEMDIIPNEYIIVLKDNVQRDAHIAGLLQLIGVANPNNRIGFLYEVINGFSATLTELLLNGELLNPDVKYIEANQRFHASFANQSNPEWGLDRIDQRSSTRDNKYYYNSTAGENTDIYIIDTGIRTTHNEFGGRATAVFNAIQGESNQDLNGHGTHVAGITAGATYGVAKNAALKAVKVLSATGSGSTDGVIAGIDYVAKNKDPNRRSVANLSLGGPFSQALDDAVVRSINAGIIMVVAAGNDGLFACLFSPARVSAAITVGATEITNARASYSNFGSCVTLFAPGSDILSSWFTSDSATNSISGTSMATPFVAGVLAVQVSQFPMTHAQAKQWLISTSTPNAVSGAGLFSPNRLLYAPYV